MIMYVLIVMAMCGSSFAYNHSKLSDTQRQKFQPFVENVLKCKREYFKCAIFKLDCIGLRDRVITSVKILYDSIHAELPNIPHAIDFNENESLNAIDTLIHNFRNGHLISASPRLFAQEYDQQVLNFQHALNRIGFDLNGPRHLLLTPTDNSTRRKIEIAKYLMEWYDLKLKEIVYVINDLYQTQVDGTVKFGYGFDESDHQAAKKEVLLKLDNALKEFLPESSSDSGDKGKEEEGTEATQPPGLNSSTSSLASKKVDGKKEPDLKVLKKYLKPEHPPNFTTEYAPALANNKRDTFAFIEALEALTNWYKNPNNCILDIEKFEDESRIWLIKPLATWYTTSLNPRQLIPRQKQPFYIVKAMKYYVILLVKNVLKYLLVNLFPQYNSDMFYGKLARHSWQHHNAFDCNAFDGTKIKKTKKKGKKEKENKKGEKYVLFNYGRFKDIPNVEYEDAKDFLGTILKGLDISEIFPDSIGIYRNHVMKYFEGNGVIDLIDLKSNTIKASLFWDVVTHLLRKQLETVELHWPTSKGEEEKAQKIQKGVNYLFGMLKKPEIHKFISSTLRDYCIQDRKMKKVPSRTVPRFNNDLQDRVQEKRQRISIPAIISPIGSRKRRSSTSAALSVLEKKEGSHVEILVLQSPLQRRLNPMISLPTSRIKTKRRDSHLAPIQPSSGGMTKNGDPMFLFPERKVETSSNEDRSSGVTSSSSDEGAHVCERFAASPIASPEQKRIKKQFDRTKAISELGTLQEEEKYEPNSEEGEKEERAVFVKDINQFRPNNITSSSNGEDEGSEIEIGNEAVLGLKQKENSTVNDQNDKIVVSPSNPIYPQFAFDGPPESPMAKKNNLSPLSLSKVKEVNNHLPTPRGHPRKSPRKSPRLNTPRVPNDKNTPTPRGRVRNTPRAPNGQSPGIENGNNVNKSKPAKEIAAELPPSPDNSEHIRKGGNLPITAIIGIVIGLIIVTVFLGTVVFFCVKYSRSYKNTLDSPLIPVCDAPPPPHLPPWLRSSLNDNEKRPTLPIRINRTQSHHI